MTAIDCGAVQDRMPDVANAAARWNDAEGAHIASCESCALEWQVVSAARRLGNSAARQIDTAKLSAAVVAGVRAHEKRSRWVRNGWVGGLAAAAMIVVLVRVNWEPSRRAAEPPIDSGVVAVAPRTSGLPMAELDALDESQLEAVLEQLDAAAGSLDGGVAPRIGDLDDQQLERVLRSLEG